MKIAVVLPVYHGSAADRLLTEFCARNMEYYTSPQSSFASPWQLFIVERESEWMITAPMMSAIGAKELIVTHEPTTYVEDFNRGMDAAEEWGATHVVHVGNDVVTAPGWLEALVEPWERFPDCGASTTAIAEPGAFVGPREPVPGLIVEGMYGPLMMFEATERLVHAYVGCYSDNDLIMRLYQRGKRAYRNCGVQCVHLNRRWSGREGASENEARGKEAFEERWRDSPLMMAKVIRSGAVVFGREHEF